MCMDNLPKEIPRDVYKDTANWLEDFNGRSHFASSRRIELLKFIGDLRYEDSLRHPIPVYSHKKGIVGYVVGGQCKTYIARRSEADAFKATLDYGFSVYAMDMARAMGVRIVWIYLVEGKKGCSLKELPRRIYEFRPEQWAVGRKIKGTDENDPQTALLLSEGKLIYDGVVGREPLPYRTVPGKIGL